MSPQDTALKAGSHGHLTSYSEQFWMKEDGIFFFARIARIPHQIQFNDHWQHYSACENSCVKVHGGYFVLVLKTIKPLQETTCIEFTEKVWERLSFQIYNPAPTVIEKHNQEVTPVVIEVIFPEIGGVLL